MFTLLPEQYKNSMLKAYRSRLLTLILMGLSIVVGICLLLSFSARVFVLGKQQELTARETALRQLSDNFSKNDLGINLEDLKQDLDLLSKKSFNVSSVFDQVTAQSFVGIVIDKYEYILFEETKFIVTISGKAPSRKTLSQFAENLRKEKGFGTVELPISSLAKDTDLPFSIKITGSHE